MASRTSSNLPVAHNLTELVNTLRTAEHKTTEEAFDHLADLVGPSIRIRYEVMKGTESSNQDADEPVAKTGNNVRHSRFGHLNELVVRRVLLTSNRKTANFSSELVQQCNGVVLEYPNWNILSIPPPMFNPRYRMSQLKLFVQPNNQFDKLSVYEVKDGTTITLYYFNGKWCMASTNGFEVNDYQFLGVDTYMSALTEVTKLYPDFSWDKLNKSHCYTVGFRHHEFHPLLTDSQKMWFIISHDLEQANAEKHAIYPGGVLPVENIGIAAQQAVPIPEGVNPVQWMTSKNLDALTRYFCTLRPSEKTDKSPAVPEIHYGFILRGWYGDCGEMSNIMLESTLMKTIRQLMYNLPRGKYTQISPSTPRERLEYTILRAYLGYKVKYNFLNLFPQFTPQYDKYTDLFNKLVSRIFNALRNKQIRASLSNRNGGGRKKNNLGAKIDTLAMAFIPHIEAELNINPFDSQGQNVILDFISDQKYIDIFYTCLIDESNE